MSVNAFRCTPEDLPDLDKKTRNGLEPLLGALNNTIPQLVSSANGQVLDEVKTMGISVDTTLDSVFPLKFSTIVAQPRVVVLSNCVPMDPAHSLATAFVAQAWQLTSTGLILIPAISGILVSNKYTLTFWIS